MDIRKNDAKFGSPILLTMVLLIIIPSSAGFIDCRISCRRCHENTEHAAVLEVYCAMCEECKQRRRERMLGKTKGKTKPTADKQQAKMRGVEVGTDNEALILRPQESLQQAEEDSQLQYQEQPQQQYELQQQPVYEPTLPPQRPEPLRQPQRARLAYKPRKAIRELEYPPHCPTPPLCSDDEDASPVPQTTTKTTTTKTTTTTMTSTTTTSTTTTTLAPCPPITHCRRTTTYRPPPPPHPPYPPPCMNPCMMPMCPCPMWPYAPMPPPWPSTHKQPDFTHALNDDYDYVFIGLPKT